MAIRLLEDWKRQEKRDGILLNACQYMREEVVSETLPVHFDLDEVETLSQRQILELEALSIEAARMTISSVASLSELNEVDHMGGGLDLIMPLLLTLAVVDYKSKEFTIEHAHTSIGYFTSLAALGFLDPSIVIGQFRRGLDIPGHVSWVPGGTQLNGGRLGVMVPAAVGQALGKKARYGNDAFVLCHCGDASWISGQALNGFNAADLHDAPVAFIMHRNGIQLSGSNRQVMDKDPRPIIEAMGITILETPTLHDYTTLFPAYREARRLALEGRPSMIYPTGLTSTTDCVVDLNYFGNLYGILAETQEKAEKNEVPMTTEVWVPGALMSYRDVESMLDCVFLVNSLAGGRGHHDGHMMGRDAGKVLAGSMLQMTDEQQAALDVLKGLPKEEWITKARPSPGTKNLLLTDEKIASLQVPNAGEKASPRVGSEAVYTALAEEYPTDMFVIGCDIDASTKLAKARTLLPSQNQFEMSIEEQASAIMANGLSVSTMEAQLVVFSTFSAFFAGIAREGFEMWRYQRNLNGVNEGLNVTMHLSHVGACTGRDHFSGWDLDWINTALSYLPYLHRFYAPADARIAAKAVRDMAAHYGAHIIGIPRDVLPVLTRQDSNEPLYKISGAWENITVYRTYSGAEKAIITMGAPSYLAGEAAEQLNTDGIPTDVYIINALPLNLEELTALLEIYPKGVVTLEDGIISSGATCLQGLAGLIANVAGTLNIPIDYIGICDPRVAPSDGFVEVWEHFGISARDLYRAVKEL